MAQKCNNCGASITCGCQRAKAADGKSCCKKCVSAYNKTISKTSPNAKMTYSGPGKQI